MLFHRRNCSVLTLDYSGIQTGIKVDLEDFMEFIRSTQLSFESCIDRVYDFEQAAEALEYSRSSKLFGKVIVKVA